MDVGSRFFHRTGSVDFLSEPYNVRQRYTAYLPDADDATSFKPVPRRPPQPSPIRRHSETPSEAARRRQGRRAVVSNPIIGSEFDENNNELSDVVEDVYTTDFIGSGLKKLRSNSWESLVRWEKENEILHAFIEDECEWLAELFPEERSINPKHFFQTLQDGVVLVKLAELCQNYAESYGLRNNIKFPFFTVTCHPHEKCNGPMGRFLSRENVDLFIRWCRAHKINECILFESNDVVEQDDTLGLREGAREIVLCLMELARYGVKFGLKAPKLIMLEKEIEYEEEMEHIDGSTSPRSCDSGVDIESDHFNLSYLGNDQYQVELQDSPKCADFDPETHNYNDQQCTLCNVFGHSAEVCDHPNEESNAVFDVDGRGLNNNIAVKLMDSTNTIISNGQNDYVDANNNSLGCNDENTMDSSTRELLNNRRNVDLNNGIIRDDKYDHNRCEDTTALLKENYSNGHTIKEAKGFTSNDSVSSGPPSPTKKGKSKEASESDVVSQRTPRRSSSNVSTLSKSDLHNIVTKIVEEYNIEKITKLKEGKYIILGKIMFVRLLNQHCIVRIGGGWDTLEHYIMTHVNKSSVAEIDFKPANEARKKKQSGSQQHHSSNPDLSAESPAPKTPTGSRFSPLNARDPYIQEKAKRQRDDKLITDAISRVQADFLANHSPTNQTSPVRPASAMERRPNSSESNDELRPMSALAKIPSEETVYQKSNDEVDCTSNEIHPLQLEYELDAETNVVDCTDRGILQNGVSDQRCNKKEVMETKNNVIAAEDGQALKNVVTTTITEVVKVTTGETASPGSGKVVSTEVLASEKLITMEKKTRRKENERESGEATPKSGPKTASKPPKTSPRPPIKQALLPSKPKTTKTVTKTVEGGKTTIKTQIITKVPAESPIKLDGTTSKASQVSTKLSATSKKQTTRPVPVRSRSFNKQTTKKETLPTSKLARSTSNPSLYTSRPISPATKPASTNPKPNTSRTTSAATKPTSTNPKQKASRPTSAPVKPSSELKSLVDKPPAVGRQTRTLSLTAKPTRTSSMRLAKSAGACGRPTSAPPMPPSTIKKTTTKTTTQPTGTKSPPVACTATKSDASSSRQRTGSLKRQDSISKSSTDLHCTNRHNSIDNSTLNRKKRSEKDERNPSGSATSDLDSLKRDQKCLRTVRSTPILTKTSSQNGLAKKISEKLQQRPCWNGNTKRETPSKPPATTCKPFLTGGIGSRHSSIRNESKPVPLGTCYRSKSIKKDLKPAIGNDSKTAGSCAPPAGNAKSKGGDKHIPGGLKTKTNRPAKPTTTAMTTTKGRKRSNLDADKDCIVLTARKGKESDVVTAVSEVVDCETDSDVLCQHSSTSLIDEPVIPRTDECAEENLIAHSPTQITTITTTTFPPEPNFEYPRHEGPSDEEIGSAVCARDQSDSANRTEEVSFVDSERIPSHEVWCEKDCIEDDTSHQHNIFHTHNCQETDPTDLLTKQNDVNVSSIFRDGVADGCDDIVVSNEALTMNCELRSQSSETLCGVHTSGAEDVELINGSDLLEYRTDIREHGEDAAPPRTAWGVTATA